MPEISSNALFTGGGLPLLEAIKADVADVEIVPDMTERDYRNYPAISNSDLNNWELITDGVMPEPIPQGAASLGKAVHEIVLQQPLDAFIGLDAEAQMLCRRMVNMVCSNSIAMDTLREDTKRESSVFWKVNGVECKARIDALGDGYIADLKTTSSGSRGLFMRSCDKFNYWAQLAFYNMAFDFKSMMIVAVSKSIAKRKQKEIKEGEGVWTIMVDNADIKLTVAKKRRLQQLQYLANHPDAIDKLIKARKLI